MRGSAAKRSLKVVYEGEITLECIIQKHENIIRQYIYLNNLLFT